jgi:putative addiction module component (TIGR02574 family)
MTVLNLTDVFNLPAVERLRIAASIWDSVADEPHQIALTQAHAQELDARYADYLAHPAEGLPWSEVKVKILHSQ